MTQGKVTGVTANLITVEVDGPVSQNEIAYVILDGQRLMSEVIRINGRVASIQCFESTRGVRTGLPVHFAGGMLEVELGPGLLSKNYDGLQNDLDKKEGLFLQRGEYTSPLDENKHYEFTPLVESGASVEAGDWLGEVKENWVNHKIMVPFALKGQWTIESIASVGSYTIHDTMAVAVNDAGEKKEFTMTQKWPVKVPIRCYSEKPRPNRLMETGYRIIDTFNPLAEGGTGFIPGPFGCGKTVVQHTVSKNASADIIIVAACGERANEVVEIFTEFPELEDPRTGRKLYERTTIICNTSNMPVAAREASVYTAMTIGEYYRQMGLSVLLLADSTSRWAQALREMSNRMEELPGPDAFPMDLSAIIANFYARAGSVILNNGEQGSVTFLGTVSPAGGNLKEPVTESTKKAAQCFYALSQKRADSKRYPAIDPQESYSKYLDSPEIRAYLTQRSGPAWVDDVLSLKNRLLRGKEAQDQISILGDDGVPVDYHVDFWKSEVIDFALIQQDAFDAVDRFASVDRQEFGLKTVKSICDQDYFFENFEEVAPYFKRMINALKQMNFSAFGSSEFAGFEKELNSILAETQKRGEVA
ncbi:MAG: V-type ATP synthase subunit A [Spirochaetales bacterium]|nr:V-type ATP synthase subunit A [Spirochaetales bacterium]